MFGDSSKFYYIYKPMAAAVPEGLVDWAHSVGLEGYLAKADIESGRTIHMAMKNIVDGHNI